MLLLLMLPWLGLPVRLLLTGLERILGRLIGEGLKEIGRLGGILGFCVFVLVVES